MTVINNPVTRWTTYRSACGRKGKAVWFAVGYLAYHYNCPPCDKRAALQLKRVLMMRADPPVHYTSHWGARADTLQPPRDDRVS